MSCEIGPKKGLDSTDAPELAGDNRVDGGVLAVDRNEGDVLCLDFARARGLQGRDRADRHLVVVGVNGRQLPGGR